jgi:hypothetical protein
MSNKVGLFYSAEEKWDGNHATYMLISDSIKVTCTAAGCFDLGLPVEDSKHRPKPTWTLGEKKTLDHYLYQPWADDPRLLDYESPILDEDGVAVTVTRGKVLYLRWQNSYQWEVRRAQYEQEVKDYVKDLTNLLTIVKGHMGTTAMKKIIIPYNDRDPVATMAKLREVGIPTNLSNLRSAHNKLDSIEWTEGTLSDLRGLIA